MSTAEEFIPGQRWVSNTEPELGLGVVIELENRRVTLGFPAGQETRTYASDNAPLSRVQYRVGEKFSDSDDVEYTVIDMIDQNGYLIYQGQTADGEMEVVPEVELNSFVQFSTPKDRLFSGQVDKHSRYRLRYDTLKHNGRLQASSQRGLLGPRVQLLPHQLYIASQVAGRYAPRVLLADEVGLGKTIEAGLIVHQQLISGRANRVLIVVPDSLIHQWLVEMLRRFNLMFTILDEERCEALASDYTNEEGEPEGEVGNPFESAQLVLCNLSFLVNNPERQQQALACDWDLLVVDEAHHLQWSPSAPSAEYGCIEQLSRQALGLLLLTATPEQLGLESHFARLRLLDPDRYHSLEKFSDEEAAYAPVNELVQTLLAENGVAELAGSEALQKQLRDYLGDDTVKALLSQLSDEEQGKAAIQIAIRELLDRHGTGRVLFRNTRSAIEGFPQRLLHSYPLPAPSMYKMIVASGEAELEQGLRPELLAGPGWAATDPRLAWLVEFLKKNRGEKVLVICALADTALALENQLRMGEGVRASVFHEGMSLLERDKAAAYFADTEVGAQVMLCSEIGSEGRNFQFSRHLVLFDLPLNPDLLEQRIGRLDRIGQKHDVNIHVPHFEHSAQALLLRWYAEGMQAFDRPFPAGQQVAQKFGAELQAALQGKGGDVDTLIAETRAFTDAALAKMQQGRDRLLELNSCDKPVAEKLVADIAEQERGEALAAYMESCFEAFGVDHEPHSEGAVIVRPSEHMHGHHFPSLPEDGLTATYTRELALSNEDVHFLTWEHPMVTGAMDMVLSGEFGNTTLCSLKLNGLPAGTIFVEALFVLSCAAPKGLQLNRYLPQTPLRILVDTGNRNLGGKLTAAHLTQLGTKVPRRVAQDLVRQARPQLEPLIEQAEQLAQPQQQEMVQQAIENMRTMQLTEIARLAALAEVNPNIRQEEVEYLRQQTEQLESLLSTARLKMDALRVVVAT